jgi:UDP-sugar transporter A1/2/3
VLTEVTLSGFASIYFEKVIKSDPEQLTIWERNFQLALGSIPVYIFFILYNGGGEKGYFSGWSFVTVTLTCLGAAGGILVALSIKYTDSILKTLATTGAIVLSSLLDHVLLGGPLNLSMMLSGTIVVNSISDYTFDPSPEKISDEAITPPENYKKNDFYSPLKTKEEKTKNEIP